MAIATGKGRCITCGKEKRAVKCEGCSQLFCFDHLPDHRQELSIQLDHIEVQRDIFRQTLNEQTNNPNKHSSEHINYIEINLTKLTDQLRQTRQENDFNEIDLHEFRQKLTQLVEELDKPKNISIKSNSNSLVNEICVVLSSRKCIIYISFY
jgi:hypothetical protein